jgi:DNA adenine methylase
MTIKPFFGRIGSKTSVLKHILKKIPTHSIYIEPFVGGGSVFFNKEKVEKEIINDLDKDLIEGYKLLQSPPSSEELLKLAVKPSSSEENRIKKIQSFVNQKSTTKSHSLLKKLYISRNTFGFKGTGNILKGSTHIPLLKNIDFYRERLRGVKVLNQDYKAVIKKYDSANTFIYLDPPYEDSDKLYKDDAIDLEEMERILRNIKGKFMLSLNDSSNVRKIFKGYKIKGFTFKAISRDGFGSISRKEVIITNY